MRPNRWSMNSSDNLDLEISVVKKQIVARAEGNPFYIEELLRMLVDHGGLIGRPGVWQFTTKASTVLQLLPERSKVSF